MNHLSPGINVLYHHLSCNSMEGTLLLRQRLSLVKDIICIQEKKKKKPSTSSGHTLFFSASKKGRLQNNQRNQGHNFFKQDSSDVSSRILSTICCLLLNTKWDGQNIWGNSLTGHELRAGSDRTNYFQRLAFANTVPTTKSITGLVQAPLFTLFLSSTILQQSNQLLHMLSWLSHSHTWVSISIQLSLHG